MTHLAPKADIQNLTPGVDIRYETFEGRWVLDERRDLAQHEGLEALKKRVIRRLISSPRGFYHLPTYGCGLKTKEPRRTTDLALLRHQIIVQLLEEQEILAVAVELETPAPGVLVVRVRAQTATGPVFVRLESTGETFLVE